jgi:hypothetical protein
VKLFRSLRRKAIMTVELKQTLQDLYKQLDQLKEYL